MGGGMIGNGWGGMPISLGGMPVGMGMGVGMFGGGGMGGGIGGGMGGVMGGGIGRGMMGGGTGDMLGSLGDMSVGMCMGVGIGVGAMTFHLRSADASGLRSHAARLLPPLPFVALTPPARDCLSQSQPLFPSPLNFWGGLRFQAFETAVLMAVVMIQIHLATHHLVSL